jgi:hypothetical protein
MSALAPVGFIGQISGKELYLARLGTERFIFVDFFTIRFRRLVSSQLITVNKFPFNKLLPGGQGNSIWYKCP